MDLRSGKVITFGDAEGSVVLTQDGVGFVAEPGFVAELECYAERVGRLESGSREEGTQKSVIGLEVRRELKEHEA